jgi:3',5'-cyclic AMP phosphodiesterase CpdA
MRLIHLTDPHMSSLAGEKFSKLRGKRWSGYLSWRKNRRKQFLPAVLNKLTGAIKAENADQILLTGDLIQIGLENEITQATEWLDQLGPAEQIMLVPGNHDIYAKGSADAVYRAWSPYLFNGDQADPVGAVDNFPVLRKMGKLSLIGLSSACVTPVFMASGRLGEEQLQKLAELLRQAASEGQLVCLLIHHPPLPDMTNTRKGLEDADALQTVLARHPPVLIFHGHLHHNRELQWGDSRIYCTAAASSVSESSYRVIDIEDRDDCRAFRMTLKSVAIDDRGELEFAVVDEQSWQIPKITI